MQLIGECVAIPLIDRVRHGSIGSVGTGPHAARLFVVMKFVFWIQ
jgi:hypothetical protein